MPRKTQQIETRLIAEYCKENYSQFPVILKCPLGLYSEELLKTEGFSKGLRMQRPLRPEIDAVVILPNFLVLIEAKVREVLNGLSKLPFYKSLVLFTPELKQYVNRGIIMELVAPLANANHQIMARSADIRLVLYKPSWIDDVVQRYELYWSRDYRLKREQVLRDRTALGLE